MADDELSSTECFMQWLEPQHPGETEYHQAVRGVVDHVLDDVRDNAAYREQRILQQLTEPLLAPARKLIPPMGGLDFSPILVFLLIGVIERILPQLYI